MYIQMVIAVPVSRRRINLAVIFDMYMPRPLISDRFSSSTVLTAQQIYPMYRASRSGRAIVVIEVSVQTIAPTQVSIFLGT
jgi:hypothetical protein